MAVVPANARPTQDFKSTCEAGLARVLGSYKLESQEAVEDYLRDARGTDTTYLSTYVYDTLANLDPAGTKAELPPIPDYFQEALAKCGDDAGAKVWAAMSASPAPAPARDWLECLPNKEDWWGFWDTFVWLLSVVGMGTSDAISGMTSDLTLGTWASGLLAGATGVGGIFAAKTQTAGGWGVKGLKWACNLLVKYFAAAFMRAVGLYQALSAVSMVPGLIALATVVGITWTTVAAIRSCGRHPMRFAVTGTNAAFLAPSFINQHYSQYEGIIAGENAKDLPWVLVMSHPTQSGADVVVMYYPGLQDSNCETKDSQIDVTGAIRFCLWSNFARFFTIAQLHMKSARACETTLEFTNVLEGVAKSEHNVTLDAQIQAFMNARDKMQSGRYLVAWMSIMRRLNTNEVFMPAEGQYNCGVSWSQMVNRGLKELIK